MIVATAVTPDGGALLVLGLEGENMRLLQDGKPLIVPPEQATEYLQGRPLKGLLICYGETEADLVAELGPLVGETTRIIDRRHEGGADG